MLEDLGYKRKLVSAWLDSGLQHKEYEIHASHVKFRTSYGTTGHKRFCILRINGQTVHIHGSEINCIHINLANPRSLNRLRDAICATEEPNGNKGKS